MGGVHVCGNDRRRTATHDSLATYHGHRGEVDASVPLAHCNQLEAIAKEMGAPVTVTTFPAIGHG